MAERRVNAFEEFTSTVGRFPNTLRRKVLSTKKERAIALQCWESLQKQDEFKDKFPHASLEYPQQIGRGWHGVIYKIGDYVMKINHQQGPAKGFAYPQTPDGVALAKHHLHILKTKAKEYKLPHLVTEDQEIFYVPLANGKGRLVHVQPFYQQIITPQEARKIQLAHEERARLIQEFADFEQLYTSLGSKENLLLDVFGKRNLVIAYEKGALHFVLTDVEPVDTTIAGPIAEIGMSLAFAKECMKWRSALGLGRDVISRKDTR